MERNPTWEADCGAAAYEIPHILCNPKLQCSAANSLPLANYLCQQETSFKQMSDVLQSHNV
jgi:hypothetical protein